VSCPYSLPFLQTHTNASNTGSFNGGGTSHQAIIIRNNGTQLKDPVSSAVTLFYNTSIFIILIFVLHKET